MNLGSVLTDPDQSGLGCLYTTLFALDSNQFCDIIHRYRHMMNGHTPSVHVVTMDCAKLLMLFYWLQHSFVERMKKDTMQAFKSKKDQNKPEYGISTIDGTHVLVIPLGSIHILLYAVNASYCTLHTFLRSSTQL